MYENGLPVYQEKHYFFPRTIEFVDGNGKTVQLVSTKEFGKKVEKETGKSIYEWFRDAHYLPELGRKIFGNDNIKDMRLINSIEKTEDFFLSHKGKQARTHNDCPVEITDELIFLDEDTNCAKTKMKVKYLQDCDNHKKGEISFFPYSDCSIKVKEKNEYICTNDEQFLLCSIPTNSDGRCPSDKNKCNAKIKKIKFD